MSGHTSFQCYIYACPEDQQAAAVGVIDEYGLSLEWGAPRPAGQLSLTDGYTADQVTLGTAGKMAARLREAAPGCSFVLWEDPKYEWHGVLEAYTPALGAFSADCDQDGVVVCTLTEAIQIVRDATDHELVIDDKPGGYWVAQEAVLAAFGKAMGGPWFSDWHAHEPDSGQPD